MNRILAGLASEVEVARKKEAELAQSFQEMESQLGDAAHSGLQLVQLQREADANRSIYETFLARYKQAAEQESLAMPDARLISRAVPPEDPVYPNKLRFLLLGTVGGLAIGGALAFAPRKLRPADPPGLGGRDGDRHPGIRVPAEGVAVARSATAGLPGDGSSLPVLHRPRAHPYRAASSPIVGPEAGDPRHFRAAGRRQDLVLHRSCALVGEEPNAGSGHRCRPVSIAGRDRVRRLGLSGFRPDGRAPRPARRYRAGGYEIRLLTSYRRRTRTISSSSSIPAGSQRCSKRRGRPMMSSSSTRLR